jgi:hypothetical protein
MPGTTSPLTTRSGPPVGYADGKDSRDVINSLQWERAGLRTSRETGGSARSVIHAAVDRERSLAPPLPRAIDTSNMKR